MGPGRPHWWAGGMDTTPHPPLQHPPLLPAPARRVRAALEQPLRDAAYLILAYPVVVLAFAVSVTALAGTAALVTAPVLLPVAGVVLRALAATELDLQGRLLGTRPARPAYAHDRPSTGSTAGDVWRRMSDPQTWRELMWGLATFALATVTFSLTVTFGAAAVAGLTSPVWLPLTSAIPGSTGLAELLDLRPALPVDLVLHLLVGAVSVPLLVATSRMGALLQSSLATGFLGGSSPTDRVGDRVTDR